MFDVAGRVVVYHDLADAEGSLEAIDIDDGEYPMAYTVAGDVLTVESQFDNGRLTPTGQVDLSDLCRRLKAWPYGPRHLADQPHAYALELLRIPG